MKRYVVSRLIGVLLGFFFIGIVNAATYCGFFVNAGSGASRPFLADSYGAWEVSLYKSKVEIGADIDVTCACIAGTLDAENGVLSEILSFTQKSMNACTGDARLMAAQRDLYEQIKEQETVIAEPPTQPTHSQTNTPIPRSDTPIQREQTTSTTSSQAGTATPVGSQEQSRANNSGQQVPQQSFKYAIAIAVLAVLGLLFLLDLIVTWVLIGIFILIVIGFVGLVLI